MNTMKNKIIALFALVLFSNIVLAEVKLSGLFTNNMVLQQNSKVKVWGWANPGEKISVTTSWSQSVKKTTANSNGEWSVSLKTLDYKNDAQSLKVSGENTITISNILFGEVWFCSGQSNMDTTIKELGGWDSQWYSEDKRVIDASDYSNIRLFIVNKGLEKGLQKDVKGEWKKANAAAVHEFSATAWFFGLKLYQEIGVPIGLIESAWGGTGAEVWTPEQTVLDDEKLNFYKDAPNTHAYWPGQPGILYNNMVNPLFNFKIKGAIWYQGETNRKRNQAPVYPLLKKKMIKSWRKGWSNNFPFYLVQIAPYGYEDIYDGALLREAQLEVDNKVSKTQMVVTMDIGEVGDIHPKNKQDVGKRLALWALKNEYGKEEIIASGPVFYKMIKTKTGVKLLFKNAEGLNADNATLQQFEVAGSDKVFYPAEAKIVGTSVELITDVTNPEAVRFAFKSAVLAGLYNSAKLPASSFRTDDWEIAEVAYKKEEEIKKQIEKQAKDSNKK